ncbi:hypothetical protein A4A49_25695 [Nicotiana attenuata]|uniref:Uncharacterized protein n=1 Tax=Nicotiana attenuata TaxID=49451 RepID=A0A1J6IHJ0_NICAT|nr:hypothetical protein A4A49_25695 [Nicotiana attenuata]
MSKPNFFFLFDFSYFDGFRDPIYSQVDNFQIFHIRAETSASPSWISKNWLATEIMSNFASVVSCQNILIKLCNKNERWFFVGENVQVVLSLADGVENRW